MHVNLVHTLRISPHAICLVSFQIPSKFKISKVVDYKVNILYIHPKNKKINSICTCQLGSSSLTFFMGQIFSCKADNQKIGKKSKIMFFFTNIKIKFQLLFINYLLNFVNSHMLDGSYIKIYFKGEQRQLLLVF